MPVLIEMARTTAIREAAANMMVAEVLDWRVVALDRPLELPA